MLLCVYLALHNIAALSIAWLIGIDTDACPYHELRLGFGKIPTHLCSPCVCFDWPNPCQLTDQMHFLLSPPPSPPPLGPSSCMLCPTQGHQSHTGAERTQPDSESREYQPPMKRDAAQQDSHSCSPLPKIHTDTHKPAVSVTFAAASQQPSLHAGGVLSPRASLDLSLHPDNDGECIVRISADPERAHYPKDFSQDSLIEDPTAVAVLEHAFQPNTTHPVFHVHMPSRHHSHAPSEADSEDHQCHLPTSASCQAGPDAGPELAAADHDHLQPLLHGAHHQQHGHEREAEEVGTWKRWRRLLGNPQAVPFFAMSLLMGFGTGILSVYLFLYLDELGELACFCPRYRAFTTFPMLLLLAVQCFPRCTPQHQP